MPGQFSFDISRDVRDTCFCLGAQRAARVLARHFDAVFSPLALTNGQFSLMMALHRAEPPTIGSVSDLLAMDRTTLTAAIKALARRGLIDVVVDERDRRSRRLLLKPAGRALLEAAYPLWKTAHSAINDRLLTAGADPVRADFGLIVQSVRGLPVP